MIAYAYAAASNSATESVGFWATFGQRAWLWIAAGIIFVVSFWVALFIKKIVVMRLSHKRQDLPQEVLMLVERVVYFLIVLFGVTIAFQLVGIDFASLIGFLGLGIGFAFKDLLSNFIAGVVILTQKKFKIGDIVEIDGDLGKITQIDTRTTEIRTFDGTNLIVPNANLMTSVVQNFTHNSFRRVCFRVGVHYKTPLRHAIAIAEEAVNTHPEVVPDPQTRILAVEFGESAIILDVRFWIESTKFWPAVRSEVIQNLKEAFDREDILIPFPIRTIALDSEDRNLSRVLHVPFDSSYEDVKNNEVVTQITTPSSGS